MKEYESKEEAYKAFLRGEIKFGECVLIKGVVYMSDAAYYYKKASIKSLPVAA